MSDSEQTNKLNCEWKAYLYHKYIHRTKLKTNCGIKKWRISGQINVIVRAIILNCSGRSKLNYLVIGLELAHEELKNINTFEPNKDGKGKKSVA